MISYLDINPEVQKALNLGQPIVALESTIISHGMPYPQNLETALKVEAIIRENGAVPATIGIIGGRLKAGLTHEEIEYMAKSPNVAKASRRDLPYLVAMGQDGATTVASTMIIASLAGIRVFVTGGIGGVHRGAEKTFDISADLQELAQTNVAVVCAGAKSILDLGLTLEYLETYGVPVLGNKTSDFPAFYTQKSGYKVDYAVETPKEMARMIKSKWDMKLKGGIVVANPIPKEFALDGDQMEATIQTALKEAEKAGISGKACTPFLLAKIKELTGGESLEANIELVYNNAREGSKIAVELAGLY